MSSKTKKLKTKKPKTKKPKTKNKKLKTKKLKTKNKKLGGMPVQVTDRSLVYRYDLGEFEIHCTYVETENGLGTFSHITYVPIPNNEEIRYHYGYKTAGNNYSLEEPQFWSTPYRPVNTWNPNIVNYLLHLWNNGYCQGQITKNNWNNSAAQNRAHSLMASYGMI